MFLWLLYNTFRKGWVLPMLCQYRGRQYTRVASGRPVTGALAGLYLARHGCPWALRGPAVWPPPGRPWGLHEAEHRGLATRAVMGRRELGGAGAFRA